MDPDKAGHDFELVAFAQLSVEGTAPVLLGTFEHRLSQPARSGGSQVRTDQRIQPWLRDATVWGVGLWSSLTARP